jgi:hypothetical protein
MGRSPDIEIIFYKKHGVFLKNLKMGRSPNIKTIFFIEKTWSFSKNAGHPIVHDC